METFLHIMIGYGMGVLTAYGVILWQLWNIDYPKWVQHDLDGDDE